ncbi:MAG: amidohydrolase family protein [Planctomycetes bacterium]|nr:amidohydrolase family protein [Planctomycetota bacterium]
MATRIRSKYIIGYDAAARDHVLYRNAELVFENDTVVFVGHGYDQPVEQDFDFGNSIVSPGFIDLNATGDLEASDLFLDSRGLPDFGPARNWSAEYLEQGPRDLSGPLDEQIKYKYALCKLLSCGTTTAAPVTGLLHRRWAESRTEFEAVARTASDLGIRTYLGPSYRDGVNVTGADGFLETRWNPEAGETGLADNVAFIQSLGADPLVRGILIPSTIETCSEPLLAKTREWADRLDVPVRLHATQSAWEYDQIRQRYDRTPVEHLQAMGLLNRNFLLPHAICLNGDADVEKLAASGATILHCPNVIARSGTVMRSFQCFVDKGINVALATDCCPADMIFNMYIAMIAGRFADDSAASVSTAAVFRAATLAGAEALRRPDLGRLCEGGKADIAVINLDSFYLNAVDDPVRTVVLSGRGADVSDVFVNGRHVVRGRVIPGIDYDALRLWADDYFRRLKHSYCERDYRRRPPEEMFRPVFPEAR